MKIIVHGAAGHMGQILVQLIKDTPDMEIAACVDSKAEGTEGIYTSLSDYQGPADIIIDFSNHVCTHDLIDYAVSRNLPVVIATTGQDEEEENYIEIASQQIPVFCSGNFSLGIAVLSALTVQTVRMFPSADVEIIETHHNRKQDVPSGTALMLAKAICRVRKNAGIRIGRCEKNKRSERNTLTTRT